MTFLDRLNNIREKAKAMSKKDLESLRYLLFFILIVDMFGVYWYLELKSLGIAILIVLMFVITIIFVLERDVKDNHKKKGGTNKMDKEEAQEKQEEPKEEQEEPTQDSGWLGSEELGLPSSEEYNKRLEKALGSNDIRIDI